jgi:DNA-3-methyladenine glycosylase II
MAGHYLHTQNDLQRGLSCLLAADPRLGPLAAAAGAFDLRRREAGFTGLCAIVMAQQLSTASAAAIWGRFAAAFDPFHPDAVRRARTERLARIGLSMPKIRTVKALGHAVARGEIDLAALGEMPADDAHAALVRLHGIGPWTADIYLLFCLGHADAWPAGDLALQEAARIGLKLRQRPDAKAITRIAETWRPWRGVAAHLLWAYYKAVKQRDGAPAGASSKQPKAKRKSTAGVTNNGR